MAINKVEYSGNTLIDLTSDSVTPETLISGVTAHDASGKKITGTFDPNKYLEKTGDASDTTVTFVQATNRANISSKEKISVIMGKIAKFFADLKTVAFTGKYSDLSGTPGIVSKTANGLCPKYGGTTTKFLRDDGTYAEPTASVSGLSTLEQVTAAATAGNVTDPVGAGAVNELNSSLNGLSFAQDADGNWGYKVGADAVIPFKSGFDLEKSVLVFQNLSQDTKGQQVTNSYRTTSMYKTQYIAILIGVSTDPNSNQALSMSAGKIAKQFFSEAGSYTSVGIYLIDVPVNTTISFNTRYRAHGAFLIGFPD